MKRLDVLKLAGLFNRCSDQQAAMNLEEAFGCPPDTECPVDDPCRICWRKWMEEEVALPTDQGGKGANDRNGTRTAGAVGGQGGAERMHAAGDCVAVPDMQEQKHRQRVLPKF